MTDWTKIYYFSLFVIFWYFVAINFVNTVILTLGIFKVKRRENEVSLEDCTSILHSESLPKITFILPAYNESRSIIASIESLLHLTYRYKEIIIINDGSTDETLEVLKNFLDLVSIPQYFEPHLPTQRIRGVYQSEKYKEIFVIDKENGKKFDALNAGINACETQFFFTIDADTGIDGPSFEKIVRPIFSHPNLIALGATVRVLNGCTLEFNRITTLNFPQRYIPAMQSLEYLRAFI
ncbi:MAG: Poly-beta-1,6-N-acetyl-D-glucosamine synthase, partial [Chlamydiae bacterium]|nr:Poly-beta-1,6-N-acetyl-D-glucosamine synthase [Chlamydiota bacterium]